jgi:hypothetical protein
MVSSEGPATFGGSNGVFSDGGLGSTGLVALLMLGVSAADEHMGPGQGPPKKMLRISQSALYSKIANHKNGDST